MHFSTEMNLISRQQLSLENMLNPTPLAHRVATNLADAFRVPICTKNMRPKKIHRNDFHMRVDVQLLAAAKTLVLFFTGTYITPCSPPGFGLPKALGAKGEGQAIQVLGHRGAHHA